VFLEEPQYLKSRFSNRKIENEGFNIQKNGDFSLAFRSLNLRMPRIVPVRTP
jgi:hypothetical protein